MKYIRGATVTKRLIEIDDALLEDAKAALGTSGITETVVAALRKSLVDTDLAEREARVHRLGLRFAEAAKDVLDDEIVRQAWR
ncbi:MAG: hypothetical protein WA006_07110 [Rhodoglobus sp.]